MLFPSGLIPEKHAADAMIGDCNMTYFVAEGQKCQRMMMSNLKLKTNANCKYVSLPFPELDPPTPLLSQQFALSGKL